MGNGTGFLSLKQLREVLYEISGPDGIDEGQIEQILKKADRERTGRIPFAFSIRALFGTPPLLHYKPKPRKTSMFHSIFGCGRGPAVARSDWDEDESQI